MGDHFRLLAHRGLWHAASEQNSIDALHAALAMGHGIETDVRSFRGELVLSHDPVSAAGSLVRFSDLLLLLPRFPGARCFLNVKEDGLAPLLHRYRDELVAAGAVFFDMSVPELVRYARLFPRESLATRASDVEPEPTAADRTGWIWVDGFARDLSSEEVERLAERFPHRLAFVSPALHGRAEGSLRATLRRAHRLAEREVLWCADLAAKPQETAEHVPVRPPAPRRPARRPDAT